MSCSVRFADFKVGNGSSIKPCRFQQNMTTYQNLITQSMYDKQLDSGRGTLLHLCDDVIQQEVDSRKMFPLLICLMYVLILFCDLDVQVKELIISYFILMEQGKLTIKVWTCCHSFPTMLFFFNPHYLCDVSIGSWSQMWRTHQRTVSRGYQLWSRGCCPKAGETWYCCKSKFAFCCFSSFLVHDTTFSMPAKWWQFLMLQKKKNLRERQMIYSQNVMQRFTT